MISIYFLKDNKYLGMLLQYSMTVNNWYAFFDTP